MAKLNPTKRDLTQETREQFEAEALPHRDSLEKLAWFLTRDRNVADDLVQQTYLNAIRGFHRFQGGTHCRAWLFRICRNLFFDRVRRDKRRPLETSIDASDGLLEPMFFAERSTDDPNELFSDEVYSPLHEMSSKYRQVLLLAEVRGMNYKEIMEVLDVPVGTVRSRLSRARAFLKERLEQYARDLGFATADPAPSG